jgi:predicted helicase
MWCRNASKHLTHPYISFTFRFDFIFSYNFLSIVRRGTFSLSEAAIKKALYTELTPEEIVYYIYAVLYSPTYRKRYGEFLKIEFPRVPLTKDYEQFKNLSELGKELVELHLLKHPSLSETEIGFPVSGSNTVEKVRYDEENRRVYFNKEQYFDGISKAVWEYQIGGYQVMAKYLKDRKKRELSLEEIEHYRRMAKAIERTIEAQEEVEEVLFTRK